MARSFGSFSLIKVLEISWQEEKQLLETTINKYVTDPDDDGSGVDGKFWRWWGQVIHKVILVSPGGNQGTSGTVSLLKVHPSFAIAHLQLYNDNETDPEGEDKFQKFIESSKFI